MSLIEELDQRRLITACDLCGLEVLRHRILAHLNEVHGVPIDLTARRREEDPFSKLREEPCGR